jgi:hypothetical protein
MREDHDDLRNKIFDVEVEETIVAPPNVRAAVDTDDDNLSVAIGSNEVIELYANGHETTLTLDEANRLVDKLCWALQAAAALRDRTPF